MSLGLMLTRQLSPVTDRVFLTGVGGATDAVMLLDCKITHVLNLAEELGSLTYPEHIQARHVPLRDSEHENILPHLDELVEYIHQAVTSQGKIVVHCLAGISRSASVCIAYLIKHRDMTLRQAHDLVKEAREVIRPNLGFWAALVDYELAVTGRNSVELLPFLSGTVPSIDCYQTEMQYRMRLGWMEHVFANIALQTLILLLQMLNILFGLL